MVSFTTVALLASTAMAGQFVPRQAFTNTSSVSVAPSTSNSASVIGSSTSTTGSASLTSSSSSSSASASATGAVSPAIGSTITAAGRVWAYDGCLGSSDGFQTFSIISNTANQTLSSCLSSVPATSRYAGLFEGACYFAAVLDVAASLSANNVCNIACPGSPSQVCGGRTSSAKRQVANNILLSLYESIPSVAIGATVNNGSIITNINNVQIGSINFVTQVYNFYQACGCAAGVTATALTTTLAYAACGCASQTVPTLPMTTSTAVVGDKTITVTVPCTATATGPATFANGTCNGSGCPFVPADAKTVTAVVIGSVPTAQATGVVVACYGTSCPLANPSAPAASTATVTVVASNGLYVNVPVATGTANNGSGDKTGSNSNGSGSNGSPSNGSGSNGSGSNGSPSNGSGSNGSGSNGSPSNGSGSNGSGSNGSPSNGSGSNGSGSNGSPSNGSGANGSGSSASPSNGSGSNGSGSNGSGSNGSPATVTVTINTCPSAGAMTGAGQSGAVGAGQPGAAGASSKAVYATATVVPVGPGSATTGKVAQYTGAASNQKAGAMGALAVVAMAALAM